MLLIEARDHKDIPAPRVGRGKLSKSEIGVVAVEILKALEGAGSDPLIKAASSGIKTAAEEFSAAFASSRAQDLEVRRLSNEINATLNDVSVRLTGYRAFVSSRVPRGDRDNLRRQIRDVVPGIARHKKDVVPAPVAQIGSGTVVQQSVAA
ncbi:MAG: hypothetical protein HY897_20395 [Deltaproteobacteria bacterium]|nr:hypothetical protein [Deltaproteobacteria bacterium]